MNDTLYAPSLPLAAPLQLPSQVTALGRHLLIEYYDCNPNVLNNIEIVQKAMLEAADHSGVSVLHQDFHNFSPYGISGVVLVQQAHFAIHTWPEYAYAAVDVFTNVPLADPQAGYQHLNAIFCAKHASFTEVSRGLSAMLSQTAGAHEFIVSSSDRLGPVPTMKAVLQAPVMASPDGGEP